ncbi:tyrosine-type recombinase/integrase [Komagataeibacter oboediens]
MAIIVRAVEGRDGIPAGFPILLGNDMKIIEPAFAFLLEIAIFPGRSHSRDTLRTYAEHLHDWFDSLEQSNLDWREAGEETVAAYRNRMLERPSAHTGRPYARTTINDRIRSVCRFYDWLHRKGWVSARPFHLADVRISFARRQAFLSHLSRYGTTISANVLTVAEYEKLPRPLRVDELRQLFENLVFPYDLMAEWAVATGLRRLELCGLSVGQIPDSANLDANRHPLMGVSLFVTKGDRPRTAYAPLRLIDRTHWYIGEDRAALIRRCQRVFPGYQAPSPLFLNKRGVGISRARLTAVFSEAFRSAGLDGSLHWLRHTFAMTMLVRLQAHAAVKPEMNPLKVLQVLLGHSSIQTTAIYLRCVEIHGRELAESLDYLYGSLIDAA